jgi:hypothetical protein
MTHQWIEDIESEESQAVVTEAKSVFTVAEALLIDYHHARRLLDQDELLVDLQWAATGR